MTSSPPLTASWAPTARSSLGTRGPWSASRRGPPRTPSTSGQTRGRWPVRGFHQSERRASRPSPRATASPRPAPGPPPHAGPRPAGPPPAQKSWSEQDLLHSRPGGQALPSDPWRGDPREGLCLALGRLLSGRPTQQGAPGPARLPQLHSPTAGKAWPSSALTPGSLSETGVPWGGPGWQLRGGRGREKRWRRLLRFCGSDPPLRAWSLT